MITTFKKDVQIRHSRKEIERLARSERIRYRIWIDNDDGIADSSVKSVNADEEMLNLGNVRYRCKLYVGEREICSVQGWSRIYVETAAADEAIQVLTVK